MSETAFLPISRPISLVEEVGKKLSDFIRRGMDPTMRSLPSERSLAEMLGVSRPVVREAIQRLQLQGLVEIKHGVGTVVVDKLHKPISGSLELLVPDEKERLRQLNETRLAIEPMSARLAAERATEEQIRSLWDIHAELESTEDIDEAISIDLRFHRTLAEVSGNLVYRLILDSLAEIGLASRSLTIGRVGKQTALDHHRAILDALNARDGEGAAKAMRTHILAATVDMKLPIGE